MDERNRSLLFERYTTRPHPTRERHGLSTSDRHPIGRPVFPLQRAQHLSVRRGLDTRDDVLYDELRLHSVQYFAVGGGYGGIARAVRREDQGGFRTRGRHTKGNRIAGVMGPAKRAQSPAWTADLYTWAPLTFSPPCGSSRVDINSITTTPTSRSSGNSFKAYKSDARRKAAASWSAITLETVAYLSIKGIWQ